MQVQGDDRPLRCHLYRQEPLHSNSRLKNSYNTPHLACVHYSTTAWPVKYNVASNFLLPFFLVPFVPLSPSLLFLFLPSTVICHPTLAHFLPTVEGSLVFVRISATALQSSVAPPLPVPTGIHIISANIWNMATGCNVKAFFFWVSWPYLM